MKPPLATSSALRPAPSSIPDGAPLLDEHARPPMRILMLVPHGGIRGPMPKHTPLLVAGLRSIGCDVTTEPWGRHRDDESVLGKAFGRANDISRIRRRLAGSRFDVLVVKTSHERRSLLRDLPLLAATRRLVPTIVVQFHGGRFDLLLGPGAYGVKAATRQLFRLCDGILVLSSQERDEGLSFWPRGRIHVVANPFEPTASAPSAPHDRMHPHERSVPTILFAGRLIEQKGIFETLTAFALVHETRPCRLVMAGDGPQRLELEKEIRELGLGRAVQLTGYLTSEELGALYHSADVFVLPTYREGFPTVVTEAMAAGLPIVTTQTHGVTDHLDAGVNALFVPPRDAAETAAALDRLLGDRALRERMAHANRLKVEKFTPERVASEYLSALEQIRTPEAGEAVSSMHATARQVADP
jgi:glycosyltransferase involved in cell wall biosynthesis